MEAQREEWMKLAEEVVKEKDPGRFLELIKELNRLLDEKAARLKAAPRTKSESNS